MKKFIREIIAFLLIQFYYVTRSDSDGILSIYMHNPSRLLFERILKWFITKGYSFISVKELENIIIQKSHSGKLVFISLDDGWRGNLELIESIENYKVPVTIFITTDAVKDGNFWWEYAKIKDQHKYSDILELEDYKKLPEHKFRNKIAVLKHNYNLKRSCITLDELKTLGNHDLITIGSHTLTHPILINCSIEAQAYELIQSKLILSEWLNKDVDFLAYPNGDFDATTIDIAKRSGYKLGFTINPGKIDVEKVNPYLLPRNALYEDGGYFENISKILGIWQCFFNSNSAKKT